jgi:hypothetical protein
MEDVDITSLGYIKKFGVMVLANAIGRSSVVVAKQ